jgi:predicted PurR-regulated permease PerM
LQRQVEADPHLKKLLPYQDEIMAQVGQIAAMTGNYVAKGLAGTATFFLFLFVMVFAVLYFLVEGPKILEEVFRFTPLSTDDKTRLLGTFTSVGRATIKGTLIIGIVQGGLGAIAFWVAGISGVVFWGALMAVASVIPSVGTALVWVPAVIYLFLNGQTMATFGGLALFGASGILVGPIVGAMFITSWKLWGNAMDENQRAANHNTQGTSGRD